MQGILGRGDASAPIYIFHHIPKCGGTRLLKALANWFILIKDFQTQWNMDYPPSAKLENLTPWHCLCGHFEEDGYRLRQRYPEALSSDRYRVFTFIRDPLMVKLSLYWYETEYKKVAFSSVEELSPELVAKFREINCLDYLIYEYSVERFKKALHRA